MNVMSRAWEIAREGQKKFGGKVSEYFVIALKMAWQEAKQPKFVKVTVMVGYKSCYLAKVVGRHPKYKLDRQFLKADEKERSYSGKTGYDFYYIEENGIYEKKSGDNREYFVVENGEKKVVEYEEVLKLIS